MHTDAETGGGGDAETGGGGEGGGGDAETGGGGDACARAYATHSSSASHADLQSALSVRKPFSERVAATHWGSVDVGGGDGNGGGGDGG